MIRLLFLRRTGFVSNPPRRIATGGLDATDVTFDIRSEKQLNNPYVITITKFRVKGSKPGLVQNMVYARSLHPIDEHLSHVHFLEEGFPFGYELIDFQLHIYNRGEEIATNIASDRVELTRDEAFEYIKMEYIGAHKADTLPSTPAMGKLPSDLPSRLAAGKYREEIFVKVSKEGFATGVYSNLACTKKIGDPYLESVAETIWRSDRDAIGLGSGHIPKNFLYSVAGAVDCRSNPDR